MHTSGLNLCGGISSSLDCPCFCTQKSHHMYYYHNSLYGLQGHYFSVSDMYPDPLPLPLFMLLTVSWSCSWGGGGRVRRLAPSPSPGCWSYRPADLPWESMYYVKRYMFIQICSTHTFSPLGGMAAWCASYENQFRFASLCRAKASMRSSLTFAVFHTHCGNGTKLIWIVLKFNFCEHTTYMV